MKLFNKFVSIVTVVAFVLSMMAVPAFAAGLDGYLESADGGEKIVVTYYKDAALNEVITSAEPGATVYAKVSANLPTGTFASLDTNLKVTGATIESETNANMFSDVMPNFERPAITGTKYNTVYDSKDETNIFISIKQGVAHDSPADVENWFGYTEYTNTGITNFDIATYELKLTGDAGSNVSFANNGGVGLTIGWFNWDIEAMDVSPFTVEGTLAIESAAQEPVITYSYDATIASTKVDPESATYEDDVKALVTVTKTTLSDGTATGTEEASAKSMTVNKAAKTVTVVFPDDTQKTLNYTEMAISYGTPVVTVASSFDYAMTESEIADQVVVTVVKTKDGVPTELTLVEGIHYNASAAFLAAANTGFVRITFIGDYADNTQVDKSFTRTNAPVSYKDVVASISGSPFAFGTTEDQIKAAIAVKGTRVEGVVETADATVPEDLYEITVDLAAGTATVTMNDSTPVDNTALTFEISEETFTYSNYTVEYTGENEYDYTVDADAIVALVKVTATKTGETTPAETVDLTNEVDVVVDKDAGTITVTWKAGSAHVAETIAGAVTNVTFNDVITYQNANATMNKTTFDEGTSEADILAEVVVTLEKLVNGTKDDTFVPAKDEDYTLSYADNKVKVDFTDATLTDIEIDITFLATGTVTLKVEADTNVTEGVVDISGAGADTEFTAVVKVEGLDTRVITGGTISISASKGELKSVAVVAGSNYNILGTPAIENNVWTGVINKATGDANLANGLLVVTVDAANVADGEIIEVKVDSATLNIVDVANNDFTTIPNTTEALEVEVKAFERNVEDVTVGAFDIGIITLGPVTDAKFVDGVSLAAEDGTEVDLTGKVTLNSTTRKIQVAELTLPVSATKDEVKYTLKVEVAGYTTIEEDIVVSYNGEATNDWSVTNPITANSAIYAGNVNNINAIEADDYITIVQAYGEAAAYDIYEGGATIDLNDIMTTVYMIDTYGMTNINSAGIIE